MAEWIKRWLDLRKKQRILNYINKECDEYFKLKRKLKATGFNPSLFDYLFEKIEIAFFTSSFIACIAAYSTS